MAKKKLLLVWWYERTDLFRVFEQMADLFDYELLFKKFREEETSSLPYTKYYWAEWGSPYQLLRQSQPDAVVFLGIDSNYGIALNNACLHSGIPSIYLEHGLRYPLEYMVKHDKAVGIDKVMVKLAFDKTKVYNKKKLHSLFFFLRSLRAGDMKNLGELLKYLAINGRKSVFYVLQACRLPQRRADFYINYSEFNAEYINAVDDIPADRMHLIGNPAWDNFFAGSGENRLANEAPFCLLIDTPWYDSGLPDYELGANVRKEFYGKLLDYCNERQWKLFIKLHPLDYKKDNLPFSGQVTYLEDVDIVPYARAAQACFGTPSTLMLPLIYMLPCMMFKYYEEPISDLLSKIDIPVLKIDEFSTADIRFSDFPFSEQKAKAYEEKILFKIDGRSMERLRNTMIALTGAEKHTS